MVRNCTERQLGKTEIDKGATVQAKGEKMESNGLLQLRRGEDRKQGAVAVEKGKRWKARGCCSREGEKMESKGLLQLRRGEDRKQGVVAVEKGKRWKARGCCS